MPEQELEERVSRLEETVTQLRSEMERLRREPVAAVVPPVAAVAVAMPPEERDFETHVGTYWLSRAGIVALITGLAFLITYHFGDLGMFARVVLGYLLAGGLAALGLWIAKRYRVFGQLIFGGGLAVAYFVTYALHFVPAVRIIDSEVLALGLLAVVVLGIITAAQRLQSETVAGIALFLGLHTSLLSNTSVFTLVATSLLAAGALFFLVQNQWVIVPLSSLVAVYTSHIAWTGRVEPGLPDRLFISLGFLVLDFMLFNTALLIRPQKLSGRASLGFSVLNWIGFVGLGTRELVHLDGEHLVTFLALTAVVLLGAAAIAGLRRATLLLQVYLVTGGLTAALAAGKQFSNGSLVLAWLVLGLASVAAGRALRSLPVRVAGFLILAAALGLNLWILPANAALTGLLAAVFIVAERLHASDERSDLAVAVTFGGAMGAAVALAQLGGLLVPANLATLAWVGAAFALVGLGFALRERWYRLVGLGVLALAIGRLFLFDLSGLPTDQRILTFILLGVVLLLISFAYTRLRDRVRQWL